MYAYLMAAESGDGWISLLAIMAAAYGLFLGPPPPPPLKYALSSRNPEEWRRCRCGTGVVLNTGVALRLDGDCREERICCCCCCCFCCCCCC